MMRKQFYPLSLRTAALAGLMMIASAIATAAHAQSTIARVSEVSGMSVAAPVSLVGLTSLSTLVAASTLTVKSIEASAAGTEVVVEVLVDGVQQTVRLAVDAASGFAVGVGTVLRGTLVTGGVILYEGSRALWFLPNQVGLKLIYHERLTE